MRLLCNRIVSILRFDKCKGFACYMPEGCEFGASQPCEPLPTDAKTYRTRQILAVSSCNQLIATRKAARILAKEPQIHFSISNSPYEPARTRTSAGTSYGGIVVTRSRPPCASLGTQKSAEGSPAQIPAPPPHHAQPQPPRALQ